MANMLISGTPSHSWILNSISCFIPQCWNKQTMVQEINSAEEFDKAIASGVVLVDFFATWCGPCKMIAPVLDKFSKEYEQVSFYKVDVDKLSEVAARFEISAMPTFLFFQNGEVVSKVTGANAAAIKQTITKLI